MSEWLVRDAGEGGTASPPQFWDFDLGSVNVGRERKPVSAGTSDFECLLAAQDLNGRHFPGTFKFSPLDGSLLVSPRKPLHITSICGGVPKIEGLSTHFFDAPRFIATPGEDVALAGRPAVGLVCDLTEGRASRWSMMGNGWSALASLPPSSASYALRKPATTPQGFVYNLADRAVAVVYPGPEAWQDVQLSPEGLVPATPAVSTAEGATLLAWAGDSLRQLEWSMAGGWAQFGLTGQIPQKHCEFVAVGQAHGGMSGICDGLPFQLLPDRQFVRRDWSEGFVPKTGFSPVSTSAGLYYLGSGAGGLPLWAFLSPSRGVLDLIQASVPVMPVGDRFVTESGLSSRPVPGDGMGLRLPEGCVGKPLVQWDDALLLLAVESGALWPDALAMTRRRWRTRLVVSMADGTIRDLPFERRLDRLSKVTSVVLPDAVAVLGLHDGEALLLQRPSAADTSGEATRAYSNAH